MRKQIFIGNCTTTRPQIILASWTEESPVKSIFLNHSLIDAELAAKKTYITSTTTCPNREWRQSCARNIAQSWSFFQVQNLYRESGNTLQPRHTHIRLNSCISRARICPKWNHYRALTARDARHTHIFRRMPSILNIKPSRTRQHPLLQAANGAIG